MPLHLQADHSRIPRSRASELPLAEANPLVTALLAHVASGASARALIVKGVTRRHYGFAVVQPSSDVDVLAPPHDFEVLCTKASELGWRCRYSTQVEARRTTHSVTFVNDAWPCDLDIHRNFPGFLEKPARAFDVLWSRRVQIVIAGQPVWIPDRASSIVIWALHSLRSQATQARHAEELRQIREVVLPGLSEGERQELADRIVELGADEPLRVVPEFAEIIGDRHGPREPGALEAWTAKVTQAHEATPWLQLLRDARPGERPWLLFRAIWPSAHDLRLTDETLVDTPLGRVQSRGRRAWRLVKRIVQRRRQGR